MAEEEVLARCSCGRERKLTRASLKKGARCEGCGERLSLDSCVDGESRERSGPVSEAGLPPPVDPARLMGGMTGGGLAPTLLVAVAAHAALLLVTSLGFLRLCVEHGTLDPRAEIRAIKDEEAAAEKKRKIEAAQEKLKAERAKAKEAAKPAGAEADDDSPAQADGAGAGSKPGPDGSGAEKSPVEKRLEEKSKERPAGPTMNLDDALDLE